MDFLKSRILILICLIIFVPLGFLMWRYYHGWGEPLVRFYISGTVYVIIWSLVFFFFWPNKTNIVKIPVIVLIATCILEFLQLWEAEFLEKLRDTLVGEAILGTSFVLLQFPFYFLGAVISMLLLSLLASQR